MYEVQITCIFHKFFEEISHVFRLRLGLVDGRSPPGTIFMRSINIFLIKAE